MALYFDYLQLAEGDLTASPWCCSAVREQHTGRESHVEHRVVKLPVWLSATSPAFCPPFSKTNKQINGDF